MKNSTQEEKITIGVPKVISYEYDEGKFENINIEISYRALYENVYKSKFFDELVESGLHDKLVDMHYSSDGGFGGYSDKPGYVYYITLPDKINNPNSSIFVDKIDDLGFIAHAVSFITGKPAYLYTKYDIDGIDNKLLGIVDISCDNEIYSFNKVYEKHLPSTISDLSTIVLQYDFELKKILDKYADHARFSVYDGNRIINLPDNSGILYAINTAAQMSKNNNFITIADINNRHILRVKLCNDGSITIDILNSTSFVSHISMDTLLRLAFSNKEELAEDCILCINNLLNSFSMKKRNNVHAIRHLLIMVSDFISLKEKR